MDLFKYDVAGVWTGGHWLGGYSEITWVERYRDPGEFTIKASLSSGLREALPLGTVISHIGTMEAMIVENVEISESIGQEPDLTITGRSLVSVFEDRIIGANQNWASPPATLPQMRWGGFSSYTFNNAAAVLRGFGCDQGIYTGPVDPNDAFPNTEALAVISDFIPGDYSIDTPYRRGEVLKTLLDFIATKDYGLRSTRPRPYYTSAYMGFMVYDGVDRTDSVTFSALTGDVKSANYLWSDKKLKNCALVTGKFVETRVNGPETGFDRRIMFVDASDIDGAFTVVPTAATTPTLAQVRADMAERGLKALANQNNVVLASAVLTDDQNYRFRIDFDIGDKVSLDSSYGDTIEMRVVEYAEITDDTGTHGYPTLSAL